MNRISYNILAALVLAFFVIGCTPKKVEQPNVLLIMADDLGFSDLGCYGGEIQTPNLDKLAFAGLRFTQFNNTGRCHSTRASLLSGYYAQQIGRDDAPEELYDHSKDAQEWYNVIDNPENNVIIQQHRNQIPQERYEILGQGSTGHISYSASKQNENKTKK